MNNVYIEKINMKSCAWLLLLACSFITSCSQNKNAWEIRKEQLQHMRDSLNETDVKLSFMGIKIGGNIDEIEEAVRQEKIQIDSCINGIYIGTVSVPCMKDTTTINLEALMRIGTIDKKVAGIELIFRNDINEYSFDFFKNTFNDRYYDEERFQFDSSITIPNGYTWNFKNQYVSVWKKTHKDIREVVVGSDRNTGKNVWEPREVDVTDAICVEYIHREFYDRLMKIANQESKLKDSIEIDNRNKLDYERRKEAAEKVDKYKKNI